MTAAYCAVFAIVLAWVVLIALKLRRLEREVEALAGRAAARSEPAESPREPAAVG